MHISLSMSGWAVAFLGSLTDVAWVCVGVCVSVDTNKASKLRRRVEKNLFACAEKKQDAKREESQTNVSILVLFWYNLIMN